MKRAILLVDHGSRRAEANAQLSALAERVARRAPDRVVRVAHMELVRPDIGAGIDACVAAGAGEIVVVPYFLGPGAHTTRDIPRLVEEAAARHPGTRVRISDPLGLDERIVELILDRIAAAEEPR